jgi:hypothetical protein
MLHTKQTHLQLPDRCFHGAEDTFTVSLSVLSLLGFGAPQGCVLTQIRWWGAYI